MIQKLRKLFITVALATSMLVPVAAIVAIPATVSADNDINSGLCAGVSLDATKSGVCDPKAADAQNKTPQQRINDIVTVVVNIFSLVVGIVAVIMIIIGGFRYITSGGDSGKVNSAKDTILYAIIGLVVVALAQFLVRFVLARVIQ